MVVSVRLSALHQEDEGFGYALPDAVLVLDNPLPTLSRPLGSRYTEQRRTYLESIGNPWPERRSRKRKPPPGLLEPVEPEG
jgi:hypothetical protein